MKISCDLLELLDDIQIDQLSNHQLLGLIKFIVYRGADPQKFRDDVIKELKKMKID